MVAGEPGPTPTTDGATGGSAGGTPRRTGDRFAPDDRFASGAGWKPAWRWGPPGRRPRTLFVRPGPYHPVAAWVTRLTGHLDDRTGRPRALVTSYAGTRVVLDLGDGRVVGAPDERPHASVYALARIDGERMIVSAGGAGHLQVSDLATGRARWRRWCGDVRALATATLAGRPVAVLAGGAPQLQIWSLAAHRGDRLGMVRAGTGRVAAVAATALGDDVLVALGTTTGRISLWRLTIDEATGGAVRIAPRGEYGFEAPGLVSALEFVTWAGRPALLGAAGRLVRAWDATGGTPLGPSFVGHRGAVNSIAVGRLGTDPVVWSSDDSTVRAWLPETGDQLGEAFHYPYEAALTAMVAMEVDGRPMVVSGDAAGLVSVWDPEWPYPFHRAGAGSAAPAPVVAPGDAAPRADPVPPADPVRLAGTTLAGEPIVLAGCADGVVRGFAGPDGAEAPLPEPAARRADLRTGETPGTAVRSVPLLVPGSHPTLARRTRDGFDLWDPATGDHLGLVGPVPVGPAASTDGLGPVASARVDGVWTLLLAAGATVYRAEVGAGPPVVAGRDHTGPVYAIVTAVLHGVPVGLTAAGDDTVRLWDLRSGQGLGVVLDGHGGAAYAVAAASVDGRALVFGAGRSGLVRSVDVTDLLRPDSPPTGSTGQGSDSPTEPTAGPTGVGADDSRRVLPEPTLVLTATGPVRSLALAWSGRSGWLVVADGDALRWCPVTDGDLPRWTNGISGQVRDLVALPELLVAAVGDGVVAYRPAASAGGQRRGR